MVAAIAAQLQIREDFRLHTGNLNKYRELILRRHRNAAEEMLASLKMQLGQENVANFELKDNGTILLSKETDSSDLSRLDRNDFKITLKVFMGRFDFHQIRQCINTLLDQLDLDVISQLIVAFPTEDDTEAEETSSSSSDEEDAEEWLRAVLPTWRQLEKLVESGEVYSLGVADLDLHQLRALYEAAEKVKPSIDHYSIDGCCTVPAELAEYARAHDIQLLTHNDPRVFFTPASTGEAMRTLLGGDNHGFEPAWTASRSVIGARGYLLQFKKTNGDSSSAEE